MSQNARIQAIENSILNLQAQLYAVTPNTMVGVALGSFVKYGCKVTEGTDDTDMIIKLEGQASGDSTYLNPDASATPVRPYQYPNQASIKTGAFQSLDTTTTVAAAPSAGTARYDIAYIFAGKTGVGFGTAQGTPSASVLSDYTSNGLQTVEYGTGSPDFDPTLPEGALPIARIYVGPEVTAITDSVIADLRSYSVGLTGTVTSVALTVPTGFQVSGSPITSDGTLAVSYAAGYQGFTTANQTKLDYITVTGAVDLDSLGDLSTLNTVGTTEIDDEAVTLAKMAHIATGTLIGRAAGGTGDPSALSASDVRTLLNVENGATADQSDAEIATAYGNEVGQVSGGEITAGTETALRTYSPADIVSFISQHETGGGGGFVDTSGTPAANDFARFTDSNTLEGRSYAEVRADLGLEIGTDVQAYSAVLAATTASFTTGDETKLDYITVTGAINLDNALVSGDIGSTVQAYDADTLKADTADTLTAGYSNTDHNAGTKSSGTYTPDPDDGNQQYCVNGGAFTLAPPSNTCTMTVHITNNGSAGAITTSGFTKVVGDEFTTTDTDEFICYITKTNSKSVLNVVALQ